MREPYQSMYNHMQFEVPKTAQAAMERNPAAPNWNSMKNRRRTVGYSWNKENVNAKDRRVEVMKESLKRQSEYTNYFGMVKLIDDYVGKVLNYLKTSGLERNTIVVFSSDHGDLVGEHLRDNKSLPYETSGLFLHSYQRLSIVHLSSFSNLFLKLISGGTIYTQIPWSRLLGKRL